MAVAEGTGQADANMAAVGSVVPPRRRARGCLRRGVGAWDLECGWRQVMAERSAARRRSGSLGD